ncbi:unnamed protein product [Penicillium glandicola]
MSLRSGPEATRLKFIIYKISDDNKSIVVEEKSKEKDYEVFRQKLSAAVDKNGNPAPRYAIYDMEYDLGSEGKRSKTFFVHWGPCHAPIKLCMLYASSMQQFKRGFNLNISFYADSLEELEWAVILKEECTGKQENLAAKLPPLSHPSKKPHIQKRSKMMATGSRDASVREAKVFVKEVVRNDWDFESGVPSPASADGTLSHNRKVCEWRVREFDNPTLELEPQSSDSEQEYGFSDALNLAPGDAGIERRRKRRRQMDDEMAWNEGLRLWMARRDAWCGAKTRRQIRAEEHKRTLAGAQKDTSDRSNAVDGEDNATSSGSSQSTTSPGQGSEGIGASGLAAQTDTSISIADQEKSEELQRRADMTSGQQDDQEEGLSTTPDEGAKRKVLSETNIAESDQNFAGIVPTQPTSLPAVENQTKEEKEEEELDEPLCPVAPPFISDDHPIRKTINTAIYPSIYTKVVVQGMTPTVPVNLAHLTKAMVQGWQSDGQWPPQPAVSSIVLADDASVPKRNTDRSTEDAPQGRRKNSITSAVKKVFHFGSHPFHRRGSQDGNGGGSGAAA